MTKSRNARTNEIVFPVALKTVHDHIVRDNANTTLTCKQMRAKLRVELRDTHGKNDAWNFTSQRDYDRVRSMFDASYATRIAKPPRVRKAKVAKVIVPAEANA